MDPEGSTGGDERSRTPSVAGEETRVSRVVESSDHGVDFTTIQFVMETFSLGELSEFRS
jgi:hypothetical protein